MARGLTCHFVRTILPWLWYRSWHCQNNNTMSLVCVQALSEQYYHDFTMMTLEQVLTLSEQYHYEFDTDHSPIRTIVP
jgi:hypothetical protein